jgi:hypothetical protein
MVLKLLSPICHDKKERSKGELLSGMSEKQAARLVSLGVAEIVKDDDAKTAIKTIPATISGVSGKQAEGGNDLRKHRNPDEMSVDEIKQELSILGIPFKPETPKNHLLSKLKEAMAKEGQ